MAHEVRFFCLYPLKLSLEVPSEYMEAREPANGSFFGIRENQNTLDSFSIQRTPVLFCIFVFQRNSHLELHNILDLRAGSTLSA